ncbi:MAG: RNA polymerase sigma factor [Planctomycetia bacterium]|nr:RNA polymerase sigma factor [Planctomycetia bacterium]
MARSSSTARRNPFVAASNGLDRGGSANESLTDVVAGCQVGNRRSQKRLYDEFHCKVYRLAVRMVGHQDAPDVLQQVFLQTFRNIGQYKGRSQFGTWLHRLAINECLQFRRRARRANCRTLNHEPVDDSTSRALHAENEELLGRALQRIDPQLRTIFLLREVEDLPYAEIARALQIAEGTVGSRLNRARSCLREELIELGWEPSDELLPGPRTPVRAARPRASAGDRGRGQRPSAELPGVFTAGR